MSNLDTAKRVVSMIQTTMGMLSAPDGSRLKWFYSFGTMLEYVADKTFGLNFDIDIGVFADAVGWSQLESAWKDNGCKPRRTIVDDRTDTPLNLHLEPANHNIKGFPTIDIFSFVKNKGKYLYTYDINREGKQKPSKYVFKTVPSWMLSPPPDTIARIRGRSHPEASRLLDEAGIWHYDIFEDSGPFQVQIPFAYGSLCDTWYPGWRFRKYYGGQSVSDQMVEVVSCKELSK